MNTDVVLRVAQERILDVREVLEREIAVGCCQP